MITLSLTANGISVWSLWTSQGRSIGDSGCGFGYIRTTTGNTEISKERFCQHGCHRKWIELSWMVNHGVRRSYLKFRTWKYIDCRSWFQTKCATNGRLADGCLAQKRCPLTVSSIRSQTVVRCMRVDEICMKVDRSWEARFVLKLS